MTRAQERAIETLKTTFLGFYGHPEKKEFKKCEVEQFIGDSVRVFLEVGYIGDEGTMGALLCRERLSVLIGKQGGYYDYSSSKSHYRKTYSSAIMVCCKAQWK